MGVFDKFVMADHDDPKVLEIQKLHSIEHGNSFPKGWEEIDEKKLIRETPFSTYSPDFVEPCRQMHPPAGTTDKAYLTWNEHHKRNELVTMQAKMYYFWDGTGVGMVCEYWTSKVRWFRFGCKHDYLELSQAECSKRGIRHYGRCWHVNECSHCKRITSYDSSD